MKSSELSPLTVILAMQKVKKEQKRLEKSYKKKITKKKDFTQVVSLSVLYFGAKNCDQISL